MARLLTLALVVLAVLAGPSTEASATDVVFDQELPLESYVNVRFSDPDTGWITADTFCLETGATVNGLVFWGAYVPDGFPAVQLFMVRFYADDGGRPGPLVLMFGAVGSAIVTGRVTPTAPPLTIIRHNVWFSDLTLGPGSYWVSVADNSEKRWGWARTETPGTTFQSTTGGATWFPDGFQVGFQVLGTATPAVGKVKKHEPKKEKKDKNVVCA